MNVAVKEKRTKLVNLKVSESEKVKFELMAQAKGLTLSAYIRMLLIEQAERLEK